MSAGRPLGFDPERALDQALALFWRRGYGASSLQALTRAMRLSRSSFYHTFGSKHGLLQRCIARYRERMTERLQEGLDRAPSARGYIEAVLESALEDGGGSRGGRGCFVVSCANELGARDKRIAHLTRDALESFRAVFTLAIERAQREGEVARDADPRVLAAHLVAVLCGLRTMARSAVDRETAAAAVRGALRALD